MDEPTMVALEFHIAALDTDCWVKVDGHTVERIHSFDIHAEWGSVTTFVLRGILSDGKPIAYRGQLALDEPQEGA